VDLLDDRVAAVGRNGCDGVEHLGVGGGEERVEPPEVEQSVLPVSKVLFGVEVGDSAHHEPAVDVVGLLLWSERDERGLGDLGAGDPAAGSLVEDRVGVLDGGPRVVGIDSIAALTRWSIRTVTKTAAPPARAACTGPRP